VALWDMLKYRSHDAHMPMAEFYMFGRRQDYSYALPDPQAIIRRRHHIRIWKTQYTLAGVPLWAGAATYDAILEYAKAAHLVNHIIDPNVDAKRDFIGNDIAAKDARRQYIQSKNPVTEADTTSGHPYSLTAGCFSSTCTRTLPFLGRLRLHAEYRIGPEIPLCGVAANKSRFPGGRPISWLTA